MPVIETKISIDSEEYLLNYKHHQELSVELSYLLHEIKKMGSIENIARFSETAPSPDIKTEESLRLEKG